MIKVVFDTVVFVRCLINPHSIWGSVIFLHYSDYRLFVSPPVLKEILEVLRRPELTQKFKSLEKLDINKVLQILSSASVVEISDIPTASQDIKDNKFLATAEKAKVDYLVSEDRDLLTLKEYNGFKIIDTKTFLQILKSVN